MSAQRAVPFYLLDRHATLAMTMGTNLTITNYAVTFPTLSLRGQTNGPASGPASARGNPGQCVRATRGAVLFTGSPRYARDDNGG